MRSNFKDSFSLEKRMNESSRIISKYPARIPCIVENNNNSYLVLDKNKFLVPNDITIGQFIFVLRKRVNIRAKQALFLFVNNTIPPSSRIMSDIYREHKNEDNFLYFVISSENTFGKI